MTNPYLQDEFAPVRDEVTLTDLPVAGRVPEHLDGRYLRIGPNPLGDPGPDYHWFLGDGMVHGLRLRDGKAQWYRNRYVRSGSVATAFGEQPRPGARPHAGMDFAPNTNIIGHAGRTLALVEAGPRPYELTDELETVGACDFDGTLDGGYTAHPLTDPQTGELHAVSYFFGWGNTVRYTVTGVDGRVRRSVDVEVHGSPMMHSFSLTERYVVLYDLPAVFDPRVAASSVPKPIRPMARLSMRPFIGRNPIPERIAAAMLRSSGGFAAQTAAAFPYRWDERYPARVGIMLRDGDAADVRWFDVEPCYVFHPLNAYDDGESVVLDVVRHPKVFATEFTGPNEGDPTLERWTVDLLAGKVREERRDDRAQEFPRVDDRLVGRRHRFGYAVAFGDGIHGDGLLRHDLVSGHQQTRTFAAGQTAGEFAFVPNGPDAAEDDGVLMGYLHDAAQGTSALVLLDSVTLEDVARIQLPVRVPAGFHGNWVPMG